MSVGSGVGAGVGDGGSEGEDDGDGDGDGEGAGDGGSTSAGEGNGAGAGGGGPATCTAGGVLRAGRVALGTTDRELESLGTATTGVGLGCGGMTTGRTDGVGMSGASPLGEAVLATVAGPVLTAVRIGMEAVPASNATVNR